MWHWQSLKKQRFLLKGFFVWTVAFFDLGTVTEAWRAGRGLIGLLISGNSWKKTSFCCLQALRLLVQFPMVTFDSRHYQEWGHTVVLIMPVFYTGQHTWRCPLEAVSKAASVLYLYRAFVLVLMRVLSKEHWDNGIERFYLWKHQQERQIRFMYPWWAAQTQALIAILPLSYDDWPAAAPSAGQTNQWRDESPTQQYSKPFMYFFYLISESPRLVVLPSISNKLIPVGVLRSKCQLGLHPLHPVVTLES